jgi:hypothetical protein
MPLNPNNSTAFDQLKDEEILPFLNRVCKYIENTHPSQLDLAGAAQIIHAGDIIKSVNVPEISQGEKMIITIAVSVVRHKFDLN